MKQLIFIGAPGSGKGTQSEWFVAKKQYKHISTGDLLRSEISSGTELGLKVKSIMDKGNLVSDEIVLQLLEANCDLKKNVYIFDGYPRTLSQAKTLVSNFLCHADYKAIYFKLEKDFLLQRLTNRRSCSQCGMIYNLVFSPPKIANHCDKCGFSPLVHRKDDTEEVIRNRFEVFEATVGPVISFFKELGRLVEVDASMAAESVYQDILQKI